MQVLKEIILTGKYSRERSSSGSQVSYFYVTCLKNEPYDGFHVPHVKVFV